MPDDASQPGDELSELAKRLDVARAKQSELNQEILDLVALVARVRSQRQSKPTNQRPQDGPAPAE
jgi:hypothetical protein